MVRAAGLCPGRYIGVDFTTFGSVARGGVCGDSFGDVGDGLITAHVSTFSGVHGKTRA